VPAGGRTLVCVRGARLDGRARHLTCAVSDVCCSAPRAEGAAARTQGAAGARARGLDWLGELQVVGRGVHRREQRRRRRAAAPQEGPRLGGEHPGVVLGRLMPLLPFTAQPAAAVLRVLQAAHTSLACPGFQAQAARDCFWGF